MGVDVAAWAEWPGSWLELSRRLGVALAGSAASWEPSPFAGEPVGSLELAPADPLVVGLREGLLMAQVRTSPYGPGFHQAVVELLDRLAEILPGGRWAKVHDGTGYWERRDEVALRAAFLRWATAVWSEADGVEGLAMCLARDEGPAEVPSGHVATPTGFKSHRWVEATRAALARARARPDEPPERAAREAFLWWARERDAWDWVQLGRAVCTRDVIWRALADGDDAGQVGARLRALTCFENALRIDPGAPVPLEELRRLYALLGREHEAAGLAARAAPEPFRGGYREGWVRCHLGGWDVQLPGWLRAGVDGIDGHDVFWDDRITVHLSTLRPEELSRREFSLSLETDRHLRSLAPDERARARVELLANGPAEGYAVIVPGNGDPGDPEALIQGQLAHAGDRLCFTAVARSREAADLALRLGRSLRPVATVERARGRVSGS